jgi:hypothetical protein
MRPALPLLAAPFFGPRYCHIFLVNIMKISIERDIASWLGKPQTSLSVCPAPDLWSIDRSDLRLDSPLDRPNLRLGGQPIDNKPDHRSHNDKRQEHHCA